MEIEFKDPPDHGNSSADWDGIAAALKARPGEWAVIHHSNNNSISTRIKSGVAASFRPAGAFEARAISVRDRAKKFDIYARYVGATKEEEASGN